MDAESILKGLNGDQRMAVLHDHKQNGALLILAGAGSGKTSVLTKRIQYRIGASYTNPYLKVNGIDGPKEYSITAGIGLPIPFSRALSPNNRSVLNLGLEWLRRTPSNPSHVTENYVMLNVGVTINEAWFMKYKIH